MEEQFDRIELFFRLKDIQLGVQNVDYQINVLELEREKLTYEFEQLSKVYEDIIKEELTEQVEKPKKLKKTNDKLSENHIEIQQ